MQTPNSATTEPKTSRARALDQAHEELAALRDELRVQAALGKAEAKALWSSIEPRLTAATTRLDAARVQAHLAALDADERAARAAAELHAASDTLDRGAEKVAAELRDRARDLKRRLLA
jgi:hypothetical protein